MATISNWAFQVFSKIEECEVYDAVRINGEILTRFRRDDKKVIEIRMNDTELQAFCELLHSVDPADLRNRIKNEADAIVARNCEFLIGMRPRTNRYSLEY